MLYFLRPVNCKGSYQGETFFFFLIAVTLAVPRTTQTGASSAAPPGIPTASAEPSPPHTRKIRRMGQMQKRISDKTRQKNKREDIKKWDQTDSHEIPDRWETSESPGSGGVVIGYRRPHIKKTTSGLSHDVRGLTRGERNSQRNNLGKASVSRTRTHNTSLRQGKAETR